MAETSDGSDNWIPKIRAQGFSRTAVKKLVFKAS